VKEVSDNMRPRARLIFLTVLFILAGCATPMPGENCQSREEDPPSSAIIPGPEVRAADISSGKATGSELPAAAEQRNEAAGPLVIEPGSPIPDFDLDILFIHAHPDDESLDYASLLALADEAGMTTGLLIFTDGESGLDTYPDRPVTPDLYPDHYLKGEELSAVRSGELVRASAILGVDLLIRLGLRNSPYNTWLDEKPVEEMMDRWGGEELLKETIAAILAKTSPQAVVSPEPPGETLEHFEHEAIGYLVEKVLTEEEGPFSTPRSYLTCIDPDEISLYEGYIKIPAVWQTVTGTSLREIKQAALSEHRTQKDAVIYGMASAEESDGEYYEIRFGEPLKDWKNGISQ